MMDLLTEFSGIEIIVCGVAIILAVKGAWDIIDFFKKKYQEKFDKDYSKKHSEEELIKHYQECKEQHKESVALNQGVENKLDKLAEIVDKKFDQLDKRIDELDNRVDILTESDCLNIKHDIVKDYHYFTEQAKWIDDYNLSTLNLMYSKYKAEGGNSFVDELMEEINKLPKHPPVD